MEKFYFSERVLFILQQRSKKKTFREIGRELHISGERVRQIFLASRREVREFCRTFARELGLADTADRYLFMEALTLCILNGGFPENLCYTLALSSGERFDEIERRLSNLASRCRNTDLYRSIADSRPHSADDVPGYGEILSGLTFYARGRLMPDRL